MEKFVEQNENHIFESIADNKAIIVSLLNQLNKTEDEGKNV